MNDFSRLPLELYKANIEFQTKVGKLLQENGEHWVKRGQDLLSENLKDTDTEIKKLLDLQDWNKQTAESMTFLPEQLQKHINDNMSVLQVAMEAQVKYASGLQDAVHAWQQQTTEAIIGFVPPTISNTVAWSNLFKPFEQMLKYGPTETISKTKK